MSHSEHHPEPVEDCFGCKVSGIGYQSHQSSAGGRRSDPLQRKAVVAEEGPARGSVVGHYVQHWDDRQDAHVRPPTVTVRTAETGGD